MPYAPSSAGLPTLIPVSPSRPHSRPPHSRTVSKESMNDATVLYTAVKSLYDLTGDVKAVFGKHYVPETASFIDPLVTVTHDTKACVGQFRALRGLFSRAEIKTRSVTRGGNHLVIDWQIKYFPRGLPSPVCLLSAHHHNLDLGDRERGPRNQHGLDAHLSSRRSLVTPRAPVLRARFVFFLQHVVAPDFWQK
ncbi:hypothetical protein Naga_100025g1 [Nannochloropsis gaditana]|uniref:Uncharacterized protein n=1 Tax=Nannochloropsis gaditana TaxID=72520 RepID=W7U0S7_9STRA|nr:hypothetical protein Naga_100025g1 [Nannochloropsis gaditana]